MPRVGMGIPPDLVAWLHRLVPADPRCYGVDRARWRLADLQRVVPALAGYSVSGVSRLVRRLGLSQQRGRLHLHSPDPAYWPKLTQRTRAVTLAQRWPQRLTVWFGDEMSLYRQPTLAARWAGVGHEPTAPLAHRANTRLRVLGALEVSTGQVVTQLASRSTVPAVCRFLESVRGAAPTRHLILIWDNWPVHTHPRVLATAQRLHIHLLWLPTYAPWTNPIEKLWRLLKHTVLHHHRLAADWDRLKAAVAAFLAQFAAGSLDLLRYVGLLPK